MLEVIYKMSVVTAMMVALTAIMWYLLKDKEMTASTKILTGVVFGLASVASTHFGVDYENMVLNVRDMAPLAAGLFFNPAAGIIAGVIGGIERFIAGTFFNVGAYTRIACSVSTCLAGFFAAGLNIGLFNGKKPSAIYGFFIGAVMEVFHMYVVFITHRADMEMAFYVVDKCSIYMIIFTGAGMALASILIFFLSGNVKSKLKNIARGRHSISTKFQSWLFISMAIIYILTFYLTFNIQTNTAIQNAKKTMEISSNDAKEVYKSTEQNYEAVMGIVKNQGLVIASTLADSVTDRGGIDAISSQKIYEMKELLDLYEIDLVNSDGIISHSTQSDAIGFDIKSTEQSRQFMQLLEGQCDSFAQDFMKSGRNSAISLMYVGAKTTGGFLQIALDEATIRSFVGATNFNNVIVNRHVGENGTLYIADTNGSIISGDNEGLTLSNIGVPKNESEKELSYFTTNILGKQMFCRLEKIDNGYKILAAMPFDEIYRTRTISGYEIAFANIILFTLVFILIYGLVQNIIVNNLKKINNSLSKITHGDLDEVVDVTTSTEFESLSNDINLTVNALKGYIEQAEKKIEEELEFAKTIQAAALPKTFHSPGRNEFKLYATMNPAKEVGGDFYDFFFIGKYKLALVIADVSGKGIPAALFMMRSKTAIKNLAESGSKPAEIFKKANNLLAEGNDACMFVTVWIGILDLETGKMQCANAGHEYPVIMRKGGEFELLKDKHDSMLALIEDMEFSEYEIKLNPGDKLFVYTDGVPEAINMHEVQYGTDRMIHALNEVKDEDVNDILPHIKKSIDGFAGKKEQFDDITMLAVEYMPSDKADN